MKTGDSFAERGSNKLNILLLELKRLNSVKSISEYAAGLLLPRCLILSIPQPGWLNLMRRHPRKITQFEPDPLPPYRRRFFFHPQLPGQSILYGQQDSPFRQHGNGDQDHHHVCLIHHPVHPDDHRCVSQRMGDVRHVCSDGPGIRRHRLRRYA